MALQTGGSTGAYEYSGGTYIDSSGNYYYSGTGNNGSAQCLFGKYSSTGSLQFQVSSSNGAFDFQDLVGDSSNNIYAIGGAGGYFVVVKYNTSGTVQWQNTMFNSSNAYAVGGCVDASNNPVAVGYYYDGGPNFAGVLVKYNSSGTVQWLEKSNSGSSTYKNLFYKVASDSSSNLYVAGQSGASGNSTSPYLLKFNSSGTLQWQLYVPNSSGNADSFNGVATDSSYVYACGSINATTTTSKGFLVKYDTSGNVQWQRTLSSGSVGIVYSQIVLDSSSNIYVIGTSGSGATTLGQSQGSIVIVKYNSSGTLQWQRTLVSGTSYFNTVGGVGKVGSPAISVNSAGTGLFIYGADLFDGQHFFSVLPTDGSKTGTYTVGSKSFVYASSSYTDSSVSQGTNSGGGTVASITSGALNNSSGSAFTASSTSFLSSTTTSI
jgi:hypothetical protein